MAVSRNLCQGNVLEHIDFPVLAYAHTLVAATTAASVGISSPLCNGMGADLRTVRVDTAGATGVGNREQQPNRGQIGTFGPPTGPARRSTVGQRA